MKKFVCVILVLVMCASFELTALADEDTNMLPSGLSYSNIETTVDNYVTDHKDTTAAVSVAIFNGDEVMMEKAYGYTNIEDGAVNDSDAVFEWGSNTKLLTWVSVMQLVEQGAIDLNEDIRTYLPDGFFTKLNYNTPITMLNLMNHNAGWQDIATDLYIEDKEDVKELGEALRFIEPEQINKPGTVVAYSNWGAALAGYIVERVSGQSFSEYVHEYILEPLGMEHTALSSDLSDSEWVTKKRDEEKCYTIDNKSLGTCQYYLSLYPAGMATGTLGDFMKFAQAFVSANGETSPLFEKADTLGEMLSPSLYFADGKTARICHGLWTDELGVPVLYHAGGTRGSSSWLALDPESGTGMVILTNQKHESIYNCGLLPLVFGEFKFEKIAETSADISGVFVPSRSCFKGYAKLQNLFSIMPLSPDGKGGYTAGPNCTISSIGANSYLMDMGGVKQSVFYTDTDENGRIVLQMTGSDYFEVNGYVVIAKLALLLLLVVATLYSLVMLIISMRSSVKRKKLRIMGAYRIAVNLSIVLVTLMCAYIAVTLFASNSAMFTSVQWCLIVNAVLAFIPVVYAVALAIKWKGLECTRKEKAGMIVNCVMGIIMTFNVIFWATYKFW